MPNEETKRLFEDVLGKHEWVDATAKFAKLDQEHQAKAINDSIKSTSCDFPTCNGCKCKGSIPASFVETQYNLQMGIKDVKSGLDIEQ